MSAALLQDILRRPVRRAVRQILEGRLIDPSRPQAGRWLRRQTDRYLERVWQRVAEIAPEADLAELPTLGNRHNNLYGGFVYIAAGLKKENSSQRQTGPM